jgi:hypothetical protein
MRASVTIGLAAIVLLASASVSAASVRSCHSKADFNIVVSSARNMGCRTAAADIRAFKHSISSHFTTPGGFACRRVSGTSLGGQWRCVSGVKAYRFEFSD